MSKPTTLLGWILFLLDLAIVLLPKVRELAHVSKEEFDFDDTEDKPENLLGWLVFSAEFVVKVLPTIKDSRKILEGAFDDYE